MIKEKNLPHGSEFSKGTSRNTRQGESFLILIFQLSEILDTVLKIVFFPYLFFFRVS